MSGATRRDLLRLAAAGASTALLPLPARAAVARHGLSSFGDLKYPVDFTDLDYVDPAAPKGGRFVSVPDQTLGSQNFTTFNALNPYILKGDAAPGTELTFASLMARAFDEPDAVYGLAASGVEVSDDGRAHVFLLRPEARFHDGTPITAADVAFSYAMLRDKGHPDYAAILHDVTAEALDAGRVLLRFAEKRSRGLPALAATMPIFSKAWYAAREFDRSSLEPVLGSGPYRVGRFDAGRWIEYERVEDWWGRDLPVARGQYNFAVIRYEFYRERTVGLEAFKAGQYFLREEFTSLDWATKYDFPALNDGRVVRFELEDRSPSGAQGWYFNLRRPKFADARVREAIGLAFDFEWSNRNLFFGFYARVQSPFVNSEYEATGRPGADELVLMEPFRGQIPDSAFGPPLMQPVSDGSGRDRTLLKRANDLLNDAGWIAGPDGSRRKGGERLTLEFLDFQSSFGRILGPFINNLRQIGIEAEHRVVDPSQYQLRQDAFDFDIISRRASMPPTPDESLRQMLHSDQADSPGSANLSGLKNPVVDALVDKAMAATSRAELVLTCRVLDRVLRTTRHWLPQWYKANHWIAMWDIYRRPALKPRYTRGIHTTWWLDADRARALAKGL